MSARNRNKPQDSWLMRMLGYLVLGVLWPLLALALLIL